MVKIAIVEDQDLHADILYEYLKKYSTEYHTEIEIKRFYDGDGIVEKYRPEFDIILMDIEMKFLDGMSAAEEIRKMDKEVVIMFITNMTQYAIRGYEVNALDYIIKPIEYFSFSKKLQRAIDRMQSKQESYITVSVHTGIQKLLLQKILYIESQGHTLIYHTFDGNIESRGVMKDLEDALQSHHFVRCNKGYLVNLQHVEGIQDGCCMIHGERIPVSRNKKKEFMDILLNYISKKV